MPASSSHRSSILDSVELLASGVLCVGFAGATPADAPLAEIAELAPGGVVLFARNAVSIAQTRALTDAVRAAVSARAGRAPFIAIDQEGGTVARLRAGAHEIPPMMALGAAADATLAERVGRLLARDVAAAGADVDFAPVADLALHAGAGVIGSRSFGDDPVAVAPLAAALVRGLQSGGVVATLKHFPGHGASADDSHDMLAHVADGLDELRARDFVPFAAGVRAGARAAMTAHVALDALDPGVPATLSPRVLDMLRSELAFDGVCFTDCMEMEAIAGTVGTVRGAVLALAAGADCVLVSHRLELARAARDAIVAAVADATLPHARLQQAADRVARMRDGLGVVDSGSVDENAGREAAARAITLVRAAPGALPLHGNVAVVSFEGEAAHGARDAAERAPSLSVALRQRGVRSEAFRAPLDPALDAIAYLVETLRAQGERTFVFVMRRAHAHAGQREALHALLIFAPDAVLVSAREPFDVAAFPAARTVLCSYGDGQVCVDALADVLAGRAQPQGRLPVTLAASIA